MDRNELLEKLSILQPALASNNLVPMMTHFFFDGDRVMAYNDRIGIRIEHKTGFKGLVPGEVLLGLLKNSRAKDVMLTTNDGGEFVMKAGATNVKLAMLEYEDRYADFIEKPTGRKFKIDGQEFVSAIDRCLKSTTDDTSVPDQLGITFLPEGLATCLYSTNGNSITRVVVRTALKKRAILSAEFCKSAVSLIGKAKEIDLEISDTHSLLTTKKATLCGRLIEAEKPLPFQQQFEHHFPPRVKKHMVEIPAKLALAIERAMILASLGEGEAKIQLVVSEGKLRILSKASVGKSNIGTINDVIALKEPHPDVNVTVIPKSLKSGVETYKRMAITEGALVMTDDEGGTFLVATSAD